jgi:thiol-disulfide isomerase/thioredoxin
MKKTILLSATWCGPCKFLKDRLAAENITVDILDVDSPDGSDLVKKYKVRSVPTLLEIEDFSREDEPLENVKWYTGPTDILDYLQKKTNV